MFDDRPGRTFASKLLAAVAPAVSLLLMLALPALAWAEEGISTSQTANPDPAIVGQPVIFTVTVTNGSSVDQRVGIKNFLPSGMAFVSATPGQGTCDMSPHGDNTVGCALGIVPSGGSVTVNFVATPTVPGTMTNTAVAAGESSPATPENSSSMTITANPAPEA